MAALERYDGLRIEGARSRKSGVFSAYNWADLVPFGQTGAIRCKLDQISQRIGDYAAEDRPQLTRVLGHYSPVQSINSEDSVTWAAFQWPVSVWLRPLLDNIYGQRDWPEQWQTQFWCRTPHPDTGCVAHGPEADLELCSTAPQWRFCLEAKWSADIDDGQGRNREYTQLDMRLFSARRGGIAAGQYGVIVVAPSPSRYRYARDANSVFQRYFVPEGNGYRCLGEPRIITWEAVADLFSATPTHGEVAKYIRWRLSHLRNPRADAADSPRS